MVHRESKCRMEAVPVNMTNTEQRGVVGKEVYTITYMCITNGFRPVSLDSLFLAITHLRTHNSDATNTNTSRIHPPTAPAVEWQRLVNMGNVYNTRAMQCINGVS